jgi:hypothetical protein
MWSFCRKIRCEYQDPGAQDQQQGLILRQPPQEQHRRGGGDGDAAAPGRNLFELVPFKYVEILGLYQV